MYDSLNNLKRSLRKTYKGILWKLGLWTLLAVAIEVVCVDLASLFFQIAALGNIGQRLLIDPTWLGLTLGARNGRPDRGPGARGRPEIWPGPRHSISGRL